MPANRFVAVAWLVVSLAACSSVPKPKTGGAGVGAQAGGPVDNRIGGALNAEDRRRAYAAEMQAVETGPSGAPVAWRNPDSGRYGNVVPGPAYQASGATCRQFTQTTYIDGKPFLARGTACRTPDGTWTLS
jgi:surface antigen